MISFRSNWWFIMAAAINLPLSFFFFGLRMAVDDELTRSGRVWLLIAALAAWLIATFMLAWRLDDRAAGRRR